MTCGSDECSCFSDEVVGLTGGTDECSCFADDVVGLGGVVEDGFDGASELPHG